MLESFTEPSIRRRPESGVFGYAIVFVFAICFLADAAAQSMPWGGFGEDYQIEIDPYQGDWEGQWNSGRKVAAQVVARGDGAYSVRIQDSFDQRHAPFVVTDASVEKGALRFDTGKWKGVFQGESFEGRGIFRIESVEPLAMKKTVRLSPTLGLEAPENAVVLFDGVDLGEWVSSRKDGVMEWTFTDTGAMEIGLDSDVKGHGVKSRQAFKDLRLHLEFRLPLMPRNGGQKRSNSGLSIHGYEIQILDSYGLEGYNNECGAFYKFKAPSVNMCAPPLQWQTYDVVYKAARFGDDGNVKSWPRFTVTHNGKVIHRDLEMEQEIVVKNGKTVRPPKERLPISLQFHGARVQFRNIWVVDESR